MADKPVPYADEVEQRIAIMQAYLNGADIEIKGLDHAPDKWFPLGGTKFDNWEAYDYRVCPAKEQTPDTIDWSAVHSKYRYMARDDSGDVWLYMTYPNRSFGQGYFVEAEGDHVDARLFSSYQEGTVPWHLSLVERPKDLRP